MIRPIPNALLQYDYSALSWRVFDLYLDRTIRKNFHEICLSVPEKPTFDGRPFIFVANHLSWWDGFFLRHIQKQLFPDFSLFTVMLDDELKAAPRFFRRLGAVPIRRGNPTSVRHVFKYFRAKSEFLEGKMVVSFFPQGKIWPSHKRPLDFYRGIDVLCETLNAVVLPVAIHIEPLNRKKSTVLLSVGPAIEYPVEGEIERAVTRELDGVLQILETHGENFKRVWS